MARSDENVAASHLEHVQGVMQVAGIECAVRVLPAGETNVAGKW